MLVASDTSPRGAGLPDEDQAWDFGVGASFYVDATQAPWARHYRMYSYVVAALPNQISTQFPADIDRSGQNNQTKGGHSTQEQDQRNPGRFRSLSAFAPIAT